MQLAYSGLSYTSSRYEPLAEGLLRFAKEHPILLSTHDLQEAFPAVRELDLRQMPPLRCHAPYFASLTSLRRIYISSLQRSAEPKVLLSELRDFATALQVWPLAVSWYGSVRSNNLSNS